MLTGIGSALWSAATHPVATITGITTLAAVAQNPGAIPKIIKAAEQVGKAADKAAEVSAGILGVANGVTDSLHSLYNYTTYNASNPIKYAYRLLVEYGGNKTLRQSSLNESLKDALVSCSRTFNMSSTDDDYRTINLSEYPEAVKSYQDCKSAATSGITQDFDSFGKGWPVKEVALAIGGAYLTYKLVISPVISYFKEREDRHVRLENTRAQTNKIQTETAKTRVEIQLLEIQLEEKKMALEEKKTERAKQNKQVNDVGTQTIVVDNKQASTVANKKKRD